MESGRDVAARDWLRALGYCLIGAAILLVPLLIGLAVVLPKLIVGVAVIALGALVVAWFRSNPPAKVTAMASQKWRIYALLIAPPLMAGVLYAGLVLDGTLPWLDLKALAQEVIPVASGWTAIAIGLAVLVVAACIAVAPSLYAVRSGDVLTVLMSLVLTTAAIAFFCLAKSVTDEILAVLIYLANISLSAMAYAARRIVSLVQRLAAAKPPT